MATAQSPSSAVMIGGEPSRITVMNASSSAPSGSAFSTGSSATSPVNVGA
jgi:hypothetical protein